MQEKEGKRRKYERGCCYIEREGEMGRKRKNKRGKLTWKGNKGNKGGRRMRKCFTIEREGKGERKRKLKNKLNQFV